MIITTTANYYQTLEITSRLEAQLMREACVASRPLILRTLVGMDVPEYVRRLQRALQSIYHGVESITNSRDTTVPEPLYLHVSPEEARLLVAFLAQTSAADLHSRFDDRAVARVGTLATITPVWDALRARWTRNIEGARPKKRAQAGTETRQSIVPTP